MTSRTPRSPVPPLWLSRMLRSPEAESAVTIAIAAAVGALGVLDLASEHLLASATLAVLALVAYGLAREHHRSARIETLLRQAADRVPGDVRRGRADDLLLSGEGGPAPPLTDCTEVCLLGVTLNRTLRTRLPELRQTLRAGGTVRVLLAAPDGPGPGEAARRTTADHDHTVYVHRIQPSLDAIAELSTDLGEGDLRVGLLPFAPMFALTIARRRNGTAWIRAELYAHRPEAPEPVLCVDPDHDPRLFGHYASEFEHLWSLREAAVPEDDAASTARTVRRRPPLRTASTTSG